MQYKRYPRVAITYESEELKMNSDNTIGLFKRHKMADDMLERTAKLGRDQYWRSNEILYNCALFIHAGLLSAEEAKSIAIDQRVKIGMFSFLLLTKKIPLIAIPDLGKNRLFSKKARDLFSLLTDKQVNDFENMDSALLYIKYVDTSTILGVGRDRLEEMNVEQILSISDAAWLDILEDANREMVEICIFGMPKSNQKTVTPSSQHSFIGFFSYLSSCFRSTATTTNPKKTRTIEVKPKEPENSALQQLTM